MAQEEDLLLDGEDDLDLTPDSDDIQPNASGGDSEDDQQQSADGDIQVEVIKDPLYEQPEWSEDPINKVKEPDEDYGKRVKKRIDTLKAAATELQRQRDMARQEGESIVRAYQALEKRNKELQKQIATGAITTLERSAEAEDRAVELAKAELQSAFESGDVAKVTAAQAKLASATSNASLLRARIQEKKDAPSEPETYPSDQLAAQRQPEAQRQAPQLSAGLKSWLQANPWFNPQGGDPLSNHAIAKHYSLVEQGIELESPEYFSELNKSLRAKFPEKFGVRKAGAIPPAARRTNAGQLPVIQGNKVRLSAKDIAAAKKLGLTTPAQLKAYAQEILDMENQ